MPQILTTTSPTPDMPDWIRATPRYLPERKAPRRRMLRFPRFKRQAHEIAPKIDRYDGTLNANSSP